MLRIVRSMGIGTALLLAAGAATAQGLDTSAGPGLEPAVRLELGASPTRAGFKLALSGGTPRSWAQLCVRSAQGSVERQLVRLDEYGAAEVVVHDHDLRRACSAWFVVPTGPRAQTGRNFAATPVVSIPAAPAHVPQPVQLGDVVVTEIMKDPSFVSDSAGEWIEVFNRTNHALDIEGWTLADSGSNHHVIDVQGQGLWIQRGGFLVLGINANGAQNGGIAVAYKYTNFQLTNGADSVQLLDGAGQLVDSVSYDDGIFWPDVAGRSLSLDPGSFDARLNDEGANWCAGDTLIGAGNTDRGTPGQVNTGCP